MAPFISSIAIKNSYSVSESVSWGIYLSNMVQLSSSLREDDENERSQSIDFEKMSEFVNKVKGELSGNSWLDLITNSWNPKTLRKKLIQLLKDLSVVDGKSVHEIAEMLI
jgi:hypothetical protein